jgi:radical SAM protein with 4Fe4S-binding SPASM domain
MNIDFSEMLKNRILIDYERAKTFKKGTMPRPRFAVLYISNFCVQNCQYCEYAQENKGGFLPTKNILNVIDQLVALGVTAIEFSGGGEPLVHPEIIKILNYCKKKNIVVGLITNLAIKNDKLLKTIVDTSSYVRVTIDSFNPKIYNQIRQPKAKAFSLSQVKTNLKKLVGLKKKTGSTISIGTKMVISKLNYNEAEEFVKEAIKLGVNNVQFKKVYLCGDLEIGKSDEFSIKRISKKLGKLKEKYKRKIDIFFGFYNLKLKTKCLLHINHIFIDGFGDIYLCCHYLDQKNSLKIGNIYEKPIEKIWFSKRHFNVANNINTRECNKADCRWIRYTNLMAPFLEDEKRPLDFI